MGDLKLDHSMYAKSSSGGSVGFRVYTAFGLCEGFFKLPCPCGLGEGVLRAYDATSYYVGSILAAFTWQTKTYLNPKPCRLEPPESHSRISRRMVPVSVVPV